MSGNIVQVVFPSPTLTGNHLSIPCTTQQAVPIPSGANAFWAQATGADIWIKFDGNNPSVSQGFQIRAGDPPFLYPIPVNATSINAIQAAASGILQVQFIIQPTTY